MGTGVSTDDFNQIWADFAVALSYKIVTITLDEKSGSETTTFASASTVNAIFFLEDNRYIFDKEGLLEVGDAYIMAKTSVGIKRYDTFTYNSKTYYLKNVVRRQVLGTDMLDYAVCFLVQ
jgi:hypothetical protein